MPQINLKAQVAQVNVFQDGIPVKNKPLSEE